MNRVGSGLLSAATHSNAPQHSATHCNKPQHTATHRNTLQHTATHCNTPQHTATHCNTLQHTATHRNTLQHAATRCNTLQHAATRCNACTPAAGQQQSCNKRNRVLRNKRIRTPNRSHRSPHHLPLDFFPSFLNYCVTSAWIRGVGEVKIKPNPFDNSFNTLQHTATHRNTLQHTATHRTIPSILACVCVDCAKDVVWGGVG